MPAANTVPCTAAFFMQSGRRVFHRRRRSFSLSLSLAGCVRQSSGSEPFLRISSYETTVRWISYLLTAGILRLGCATFYCITAIQSIEFFFINIVW